MARVPLGLLCGFKAENAGAGSKQRACREHTG